MEVKPGYRQTVIGVLPEQWEIKPLGELAAIKDGTHQTPRYVASGIPFYSVEHVTSGNFTDTKFITPQEHRFLSRSSKIERGDILMTRIGSIGDCKLIDWEVDASYYVSLALLKVRAGISAAYIAQYSKSAAFQREIELHSLQSAIPKKINLGPISDVKVALPSLEEQHAIAKALGDIDELLAGLGRLIAKKRDLKQAAMQQLLTGQTRLPGFQGEWELRLLGDLGATYGGLSGKSKADFGSGNAKYVTFMNVMMNTVIDDSTFEAVRVSTTENQNRVESGDLLFNGSSETPEEVALCSLVARDVPNLYLNSFCFGFRLRDDAQTSGLFLTYFIRSGEGREIMKSLAQGSTRYNLSKKALLAAEVRLPAVAEQTAIASVLSDMDAELTGFEARRNKTLALKQGMLQELLTGRTRLV